MLYISIQSYKCYTNTKYLQKLAKSFYFFPPILPTCMATISVLIPSCSRIAVYSDKFTLFQANSTAPHTISVFLLFQTVIKRYLSLHLYLILLLLCVFTFELKWGNLLPAGILFCGVLIIITIAILSRILSKNSIPKFYQ